LSEFHGQPEHQAAVRLAGRTACGR